MNAMNALWSFSELSSALGVSPEGEGVAVTGVSIDTRTLQAGDLFVALKDQRDGHEFVSAAFKAVHISSHNREKSDPVGAFAFQLIPQDKDKPNGARLRKRDSSLPTPSSTAEGVNGTGKTHHFAVKGRDDRIDWMRELMLAKAMKQKGQGFEISVNGNMI